MERFLAQVHNIEILSRYQTFAEVERDYIADPFGQWLFLRRSWLGKVVCYIVVPLELLKLGSSKKSFERISRTSKIAIEELKRSLLDTPKSLSPLVATMLSLSVDEQWQKKFISVHRMLGGEKLFPTFEKAHYVVAPLIIEEITKSLIPWDLFDALMHTKPLSREEEHRLKQWIDDIQWWGAYLSPYLLLSVCEAASARSFPTLSPIERSGHTFSLAWALYKAGLSRLDAPDENFAEINGGFSELSEIDEHSLIGQKIRFYFPLDFPVRVYECVENPDYMVMRCKSPLFLGMWVHRINEAQSYIPCVRPVSIDYRGRYLIAERVGCSLEGPVWEQKGIVTSHDSQLIGRLGKLCHMLLRLPLTLRLEVDHLFATPSCEIRAVTPVCEKLPYFSLPVVEQFIREACHGDQQRIRKLFDVAQVWELPSTKLYRYLIEKMNFEATEPEVKRELKVRNLSEQLSEPVWDWMCLLRRYAGRACEELSECPAYGDMCREELLELIAKAVAGSQRKIGWITSIPPDLPSIIVEQLAKSKDTA